MTNKKQLPRTLIGWLVHIRDVPPNGIFHEEDVREMALLHSISQNEIDAAVAQARDAGWISGQPAAFALTAEGFDVTRQKTAFLG